MLVRLFKRIDGSVHRPHRRLDQRGRGTGTALQPAHGRRQRRHRRLRTADRGLRLAQILRDLLTLHHHGAPFRQRGLLAFQRIEFLQFIRGMAQIVRLAGGAFHPGAMFIQRRAGRAARIPQRFDGGDIFLEGGKSIKQPAVCGGVHQRPLVMLAVNLHQRGADRLQSLHADRLIVEESAGAPVGKLHAAQDHLAGVIEAVLAQDGAGGMLLRHIKYGRDLALLGPIAYQTRIAAPAQRQRERVQQDGFARAGFTGEDSQTFEEIDIEPLDQDDVADRKPGQHAGLVLRQSISGEESGSPLNTLIKNRRGLNRKTGFQACGKVCVSRDRPA